MAIKTAQYTRSELILDPDQIIASNDYPLYSDRALIEYYRRCESGEKLPFVPVVGKDIVRGYFSGLLLEVFERFEDTNSSAGYFMLDGNHRTTALMLSGRRIAVIEYRNDRDIREAKKLVGTGGVVENRTLDLTLDENCELFREHFRGISDFMTVEQKTKKMVDEGVLPQCLYV